MAQNIFVDGMIWKAPHEKAPDFIRGCISVKVAEFIEFAKENEKNGWLNIDLKKSKAGKYYFSLNTYEKKRDDTTQEGPVADQDEPEDGETINVKDVPF
jgi:hypothetical protein